MRLSKKSMMINKRQSNRLLQDKDLKEITKDSISGRIQVLKYSLSAVVTVKRETLETCERANALNVKINQLDVHSFSFHRIKSKY